MAGRALLDVLPFQVAGDQIADQAIADSDQITAGRIEWVDSNRRLAGEAPALAGIDLLAAIGVVLHNPEVLHLVLMLLNRFSALRLVLVQPGQRPLEAVHL